MFWVRDLEFELGEERKTRIKQETRVLATASSSSSTSTQLPTITEKKPPLAPTRSMRMQLRSITNFMPQQPSQLPTKRFSDTTSKENNNSNNSFRRSSVDINTLMKPRRSSIPFRPAPPPLAIASCNNNKTLQARRRVCIAFATLKPEPSLSYMNMTTLSCPAFRGGGGDPRRGRYSKFFSPDHNFTTPKQ
ncbi:unnamed protein product [Eruca vesicaria subsp. sativa]|uniref:Uncharacterized protein n=1 Tax=Eruca vesicaria subsp. sativa TaxID=29727 RepID=A0ABC8KZ67_ERUVS|nr:unnamed protein product [Eruca vesicaria subsp. sativa]